MKNYFEDYPDGSLIHIFRHPAAWWASAKRHKNKYEKMNALRLWQISTENGIRIKRQHKKSVICINFENLVTATKSSMEIICKQIGLAWENTLILPTFNSTPVSSNSSFSKEKAGLVNLEVTVRYSTFLSKQEVSEINRKYLPLYLEAQKYCINKMNK